MDEITPRTLGESDGKDGRPARVVVDGKVYDVSSSPLWKEGRHMNRHDAGRDLTEDLADAPHGPEVLERMELLGALAEGGPGTGSPGAKAGADSTADSGPKAGSDPKPGFRATPRWAELLLKKHPHPITIHFPQAFLVFAPLFLLLFRYTGNTVYERTAFHLLFCGALCAVPAFLTGWLHWRFKFRMSRSGKFLFKLMGSAVLLAVAWIGVILHLAAGPIPADTAPDTALLVLYLINLPLTGALGHIGGKIAFG